ncbi:MAG TPA: hypothetical protein VHY21_14420 [Pseudonocardiaceae bacterium]|jgi:hypothetical protein|nr:hypothetical protein [Pseudonocardiaceae bacterium]
MTSPDSWDLAQHRTDAATCMEASILLRGRRLTVVTAERATLALAQLLNAVSLALAADGRSVPPPVRRAALRVADQLQRTRSVSSGGVDADHDRLSAERRRGGLSLTRTRPVPYTSSIKLGRMG